MIQSRVAIFLCLFLLMGMANLQGKIMYSNFLHVIFSSIKILIKLLSSLLFFLHCNTIFFFKQWSDYQFHYNTNLFYILVRYQSKSTNSKHNLLKISISIENHD